MTVYTRPPNERPTGLRFFGFRRGEDRAHWLISAQSEPGICLPGGFRRNVDKHIRAQVQTFDRHLLN